MHDTVQDFVARTLTYEHVAGSRVLEVGSYDVNGSVRPFVESLAPCFYLGVDQQPGPRVDQVVNPELDLIMAVGPDWDLVISTEMLEHANRWRTTLIRMAQVTAMGGLLLLTTRGPGFPYHAFPEDYWRFPTELMGDIVGALGYEVLALEDDPEPGVFVFARKVADVNVIRLLNLDADPVVRP